MRPLAVSASSGVMKALVEKLDMLLLAPPRGCSSRSVKDKIHLLKDDVEEISSYLHELSEVEDPPQMARCWMNEARDLSYDMEDYIDSLLFVPPDRLRNKQKKKRKKKRSITGRIKIPRRLRWCKQITSLSQVPEYRNTRLARRNIHVIITPRLHKNISVAEMISEFRIYVQDAIERHSRYKLGCCSTLRRKFLSTGNMIPAPHEEAGAISIDGRTNDFINLLAANDAADQQQLKVLSVLGSGCLGKTTLAKVLYNRIGTEFDCRAFIRVSKRPDMKRVFRDLFSQLHQKQPLPANRNELGISDIISNSLQDKRYLIVIDNLWDVSVWDIIKYSFPKGIRGSRIIITTQIEDVALTCCCDHSEHVYEMKPLDDDYSKELFFNRLFGSRSDCPEEFVQVSDEIADLCGGLPLATINIASHLASQQLGVSMDLLTCTRDSLRSYLLSDSTSERTRKILNLSYNNLPDHLKTCLLYFSMYQEGSIIYKDDLVKQWVAEGFIATLKGKEQDQEMMENTAGIYFDELIDRRFIQPLYINYNNKVVSCTVHDVVRDLIAHSSSEENFVTVVDYNQKNVAISHKVRRLSLLFGEARYAKTPANITKAQVRSLRFFGLFECMPCIGEFKLLHVLNLQLSGHRDNDDPIDLTGISELFQLKYLKIASDVCLKLPNRMQDLKFLETLDIMDATRLTAVPWDIINLPHLLHLTLQIDTLQDWIGSMNDPFHSLCSLHKLNYLQDLHLTSSSIHHSYHLERSMEALGYLIGGHGNLKTVVMAHGSSARDTVVPGAPKATISWDRIASPRLLQRFECSRHSCIIFNRIPNWVNELGNLCILKIVVKELKMSCVRILRELCALTDLSLYVETAPLDKIFFRKRGFSVLKYFKLRFMSGIAWLMFEENAMPNLWNLKLVFNAIPRMDQNLVFFHHVQPAIHKRGTSVISLEHMPGLREISAKFGGGASDLEYALRTAVSNHPSNPEINIQLVGYSTSVAGSRKRKQHQDDSLKDQQDEYDEGLKRPANKRISTSGESSSHVHAAEIVPRLVQITGGGAEGREHLFDMVLTAGDIHQLLVPKHYAEKYFPLDSAANKERFILNCEDSRGKPWRFRYTFVSSSQEYIIVRRWNRFIKQKGLRTGDTVSFSRSVGDAAKGRLFINSRKRAKIPVLERPIMPAAASRAAVSESNSCISSL
uniref:Uncharacterized protein n=1 Tax=Avena sativa TaxID=4498 RepID=A0ACD5Y3Q4_AVESA